MDPNRLGPIATRTHCFLLVARQGSIRQASKLLDIPPFSISRGIERLEDKPGKPSFERVRHVERLGNIVSMGPCEHN